MDVVWSQETHVQIIALPHACYLLRAEKLYVEEPPPIPQNVTVFGHGVFLEIMKVK